MGDDLGKELVEQLHDALVLLGEVVQLDGVLEETFDLGVAGDDLNQLLGLVLGVLQTVDQARGAGTILKIKERDGRKKRKLCVIFNEI